MAILPGAGDPRFTTYPTIAKYNAAHPDAAMPGNLNALRSYTVAGAGLVDELTASERKHTLDFLPALPEAGQPDRRGTIVNSR
jgi:hypothetical protein